MLTSGHPTFQGPLVLAATVEECLSITTAAGLIFSTSIDSKSNEVERRRAGPHKGPSLPWTAQEEAGSMRDIAV